jgi:glyoxylase-like metal-dependent hydrolase (beta-lactamase superfamily II)
VTRAGPAGGSAGEPGGELYEVVVVRHGTRRARRSEVFLHYGLYDEADGPFDLDYYLWVVRGRHTTVLVDTGFARGAAEDRGRTVLADPGEAYRRLGVDTDAPHPVVVTHAHYDHIGNLALLPRATIVASRAELDFWASPLADRPLLGHFAEQAEVAHLLARAEQGDVRTFTGSLEVAPGVVVTEVGGHTPGQCMVTVPTAAGTVLLTSDVVHFEEELDRDMPFVSVTDLPAMYTGLARVRELRDTGAVDHVVTGHTAGLLDRLEPVSDELAGVAGVIGRLP